jgi:hypothetical protein
VNRVCRVSRVSRVTKGQKPDFWRHFYENDNITRRSITLPRGKIPISGGTFKRPMLCTSMMSGVHEVACVESELRDQREEIEITEQRA